MNIFARKIAFFYKNREWAEKIFDKILENTDDDCISTAVKRRDDMNIVYKDGTAVRFKPALENCRGYRHHLIYLEPEVDYLFYECVARPKLIGREYGGGQVFVLSDAESLYGGNIDGFCVDARDYFRLYDIRQREMEMDDMHWVIAHRSLVELLVKHIDERIEKENKIAKTNDETFTQIKINQMETITEMVNNFIYDDCK